MKQRTVQHRETEKSKTKEITELKRENHSLKREISRLRKELSRFDGIRSVELDPEPETPMVEAPEVLGFVPAENGCPQCGKDTHMTSIPVPSGTLKACKACGWRKVEQK